MTSRETRLAYIGIGLMGEPMALRLMAQGYRLHVFDIDAEKSGKLANAGAIVASSPAAAVEGAGFVLLNLPSEAAVESVIFGADGVCQAAAKPSAVIDFSTVSRDFARDMASRVRRTIGLEWVDAPVSGGPSAAGDGSLTIMAGGSRDAVERAGPIFRSVGRQVTHVGEAGMGSVAKSIAQLVVGTNYAVLAEAVRLAEAAGMDAALLPECVKFGHADGVLMQNLYPRIARHDFAPRAYARQLLKDLEMVQNLASSAGTATPMSGQATQLFRLLIAAGHGGIDGTGIYRLYEGAVTA